jgi:hypothetical protein
VQTLTLTDIATGWTEYAPLLVREQKLLTEVSSEVRKLMPCALLGFGTDNDSVFVNETVKTYCNEAGLAHAMPPIPIERSGLSGTEDWHDGQAGRRLSPLLRSGGGGPGSAVCGVAAVGELLPAILQAGSEDLRWCEDQEDISPPATPYQRLLADTRTRACNPVGFITSPMRLLHRRLLGGSRDSDDRRRSRAYRSAPLFAPRGRAAPSPCSSASAVSCSCVWR